MRSNYNSSSKPRTFLVEISLFRYHYQHSCSSPTAVSWHCTLQHLETFLRSSVARNVWFICTRRALHCSHKLLLLLPLMLLLQVPVELVHFHTLRTRKLQTTLVIYWDLSASAVVQWKQMLAYRSWFDPPPHHHHRTVLLCSRKPSRLERMSWGFAWAPAIITSHASHLWTRQLPFHYELFFNHGVGSFQSCFCCSMHGLWHTYVILAIRLSCTYWFITIKTQMMLGGIAALSQNLPSRLHSHAPFV